MTRKILHLDLDAFFCSVEELLDPSLKGKVFAVGGRPDGRGVISSCSYAARILGVRSAMPSRQALKICPNLIFVHSDHHLYGQYSRKVMDVLRDTSPIVEQVSVDEAFLDVSDMSQPIKSIAQDLQTRVLKETGLPCSIGCATSKLVAKLANDFGKKQVKTGRAPQTITVVEPGSEASFLAPLDIQALWGIGPKTAQILRAKGINTIGTLAQLNTYEIKQIFGDHGESMRRRAQGIDTSPVQAEDDDPKSISNEITFPEDIDDPDNMLKILRNLSDKVGSRLRKAELAGWVVQIKIRYSDFTTLTRQASMKECSNLDQDIFDLAQELLLKNLIRNRPVRLLGVGVTKLEKPHQQLSLWDENSEKKHDLTKAVDQLREKYGKDIIKRADSLKK